MAEFIYTHSKVWGSNSSCIDRAYYDEPTQTLYVRLKTGLERIYGDVVLAVWDDFVDASSAGAFWNYDLKGGHYSNWAPFTVLKFVARVGSPALVPATNTKFYYTVEFDLDGTSTSMEVQASNDREALKLFDNAVEEFRGSPFGKSVDIIPLVVRRTL